MGVCDGEGEGEGEDVGYLLHGDTIVSLLYHATCGEQPIDRY